VRHVARTGAMRNARRILVGNRTGKGLLAGPRGRRGCNTKMDLKQDVRAVRLSKQVSRFFF
jgi:hypothetical protein